MKKQEFDLVFQSGSRARRVSVVIPLHNYEQYITGTLDSVLAQTYRDIAIVVVDDYSQDNSLAVAKRWMAGHSDSDLSFLLLKNVKNARLATTRNNGIDFSLSEFCFFLDADNEIYPRCIEKHTRALIENPACDAAYSIIEVFDAETSVLGCDVFNRERLRFGNYIDAMALIRRKFLVENGGYHDIRHGWEDYDLWLRMCELGRSAIHVPEILSRYRVHMNSMLRTVTNIDQNIRELHDDITARHPWVKLR